MILCSHFCLLTDGSWGRFPVVWVGGDGRVERMRLCPSGPAELAGMTFAAGVMLCGLPVDVVSAVSAGRDDFAARMSAYGVGVGRGGVCVLQGGDLNTMCGEFFRHDF